MDSRSPSAGCDERRTPAPGVVAVPGRLDLDHPGAQVAEHHRGVRAGQCPGQVDHQDVGQRTLAGPRVLPPLLRVAPLRSLVRAASLISSAIRSG